MTKRMLLTCGRAFGLWSALSFTMVTAAWATVPTPPPRTSDQLQADTPPPTAYDLNPSQESVRPLPGLGSTSAMLAQLGRTVVALATVICLILLCSKLMFPRLLGKSAPGVGKHVQIVERTLVDGKNALILVDIGNQTRLLLGSSETGLRLITPVDKASTAAFERPVAPSTTFMPDLPNDGSRDAQAN